MNRCVPLVVLAVLSLAIALPNSGAQAPLEQPLADSTEKCAPPCGYIFPSIGLDADIKKEQLRTSKIGELPTEIPVKITYSWDMEQDGTGIPGDTEEMKITVTVSKKPAWLSAALDQSTCSFQLVPLVNSYDVCTINLLLEVDPTYVPVHENDLEDVGKRLMLFATSEESGTFKKSYGVEDLRWTFDAAPDMEGVTIPVTTSEEAAVPVLAPVLAIVGLALLAGLRRRR